MSTLIVGALLSVNAGPAAPMSVQGETVVTGFVKAPIEGSRRVEVGGLVGDDHVDDAQDLDRAVLLYQRHHYDTWSRELGRDLTPGMFGEQLTIDGPREDEVLVGDVWRVGTVLLEITKPRIPCRKMAVRLGADDIPARYMRSGRLGYFCKVLEPGQLRSGDGIELVRRGPAGLTVADLARATRTPAPLSEPSWTLAVSARTAHGSDVVALDLVDPAGEPLPDFRPGQFLTLSLAVPGPPAPVVRTYTVAGRSADGRGYRIAVKREGRASAYLHDHVAVGTTITARAPRGRFVLEPGERPVALVSAGIGITPMVAMLEELAREGGREVCFVHGARSSDELAFGQHVIDLIAAGGPSFHSHVMFSRAQAQRVTTDVLDRLVPELDADFYVCGPVPFMADIVSGLLERGVPERQVHYEFFGTATSLFGERDDGEPALDAGGRPILVTFAQSGKTIPWRTDSYSLLSLAERAGLRPDASCRSGLCNTCACRIDDGEVEYALEPMDAVPPGEVLVCCARPRTSVMIDL
jgi:ferredoxin-NADP reductase/MOSC domain-containing protein YiiM